MKLSMAVSTPDAEFSALALKGDYGEIFSLLRDCGYDGAELAVRDPGAVDEQELENLLERYGLVMPAVGTGRAFGEDGLCFSSEVESVRRAAVERIKKHVDFCDRFGALVIIGLIVGKNPLNETTGGYAVECLAECARYAGRKDVGLVVEPINRYETGFITSVDTCMEFLEKVGEPNCRILFDTFHANIEEADIRGSILRAGPMIGHVHVADSNRHHPGAGHTDFRSILGTLREIGYEGFLSAEILPEPDPVTAVKNNAEFLQELLAEFK